MRVSSAAMLLMLAAPAIATAAPRVHSLVHGPKTASDCRRTSTYVADSSGVYRGQPLTPRKLTELPPATAYMAVYRQIGDCEVPLTMSAYRNAQQH